MIKTIAILYAVICLSIVGSKSTNPRRLIEKHLGVSPAAAKLLNDAFAHPQDNPPDLGLLLHELSELKQDRNLTVGLFLLKRDPDLMVTELAAIHTAAPYRAVLSNNTTSAGTTLVRPEDISNIRIELNQIRRTTGRFDWVVPDLLKGTCRFVIKGHKLEYLGVLRQDPVHTYDCFTIFSKYGGDFSPLRFDRIETTYYLVIEPVSERIKALSQKEQRAEMWDLFRSSGLNSISFVSFRDHSLPLVFHTTDRTYRDTVIALFAKNDDWKTGFSGRAVTTFDGPSRDEVIAEQIRKANE